MENGDAGDAKAAGEEYVPQQVLQKWQINTSQIDMLQDIQHTLLHKKEGLDNALIGKDISAGHYAEQVNILMMKFMEESGAQLGKEAHTKLFGMAPDSVFQIVDTKILANYHKE